MITQINIVKEPEYYYPARMAEQDGLMTYQESQKLDSIPTPSNIVTKSSTAGLLKNDGTVDTNSYAKKSDIEEIKTATGNPITLTDAVAGNAIKVSAEIVASQDLHGYDHPWVGGAGKNKLPMTVDGIKALNTDGTWSGNDYTLNGVKFTILTDSANNVIGISADGTTSANHVVFKLGQLTLQGGIGYTLTGCPSGGSFNGYRLSNFGTNTVDVNDIGSGGTITVSNDESYTFMIYAKNSGTVLSGKTFYPMLRLSTVTDSTFAPWENKCPISGRTEVVVNDAGQNLFSKVFVDDSHYLKNDGTTAYDANFHITEFIPVSANTDYILSGISGNNSPSICVYDASYNFLFGTAYSSNPTVTINTGASGRFVKFSVRSDLVNTVMFERGTQKSPSYIPYTGNVNVTIQLGTTVYGGTLNVTTGVLTVTHANIASYNGETIGEPWISSMDEYSQGGTPTTGAQVVYTLATPTTTTLTAAQLALVKGQNTLTCNSGYMSITYKASGLDALKERVDELEDAVADLETDMASKTDNSVVGTVESGTTASQAYAVGEHFIRNDKFCTCISAIASGATLTLNTNYVEGTIAECIGAKIDIKEIANISLNSLSWTRSSSGVYYAAVTNAIPTGKKLIGAIIYFWEYLSGTNYDLQFTQSTSTLTSLVILAPTGTFETGSKVSIRISYV